MGAAAANGFINGFKHKSKELGINIDGLILFECNLAPFQAKELAGDISTSTFCFEHYPDGIAIPDKIMKHAKTYRSHFDTKYKDRSGLYSSVMEHLLYSFKDEIPLICKIINKQMILNNSVNKDNKK